MWSMAALAADAADDAPRASMIAAPRLATVGMKVPSTQAWSPTSSYALFPPKTDAAQLSLGRTIAELEPLGPSFVSVTYGAGGSTRQRTHEVVAWVRRETAITPMRTWALGTDDGDWASMAVPSDGSYGVAEGIISSFPCTCSGGAYQIVQGLDIDDYSRGKIDGSVAELVDERSAVEELDLL